MSTLPLWPSERAGEALHAVAVAADLAPRGSELGAAPGGATELGAWLAEAGAWLGIEVDTIATPYESVASTLAANTPLASSICRARLS